MDNPVPNYSEPTLTESPNHGQIKVGSVPSFALYSGTSETVEEPTQPQVSVVDQIINMMTSLPEAERKQLISHYLANDIDAFVNKETKKATDAGYNKGLEQAKQELAELNKQNQQQVQEHTQKVDHLFSNLSQLSPKVTLDQEANVLELVVSAVFKLIGQRLQTPEYVGNLLNELVREYADEAKLELVLSTLDYEVFQSIAAEITLPTNWQVKQSNELKVGDHKLVLATGQIESILQNKLQAFISALNNTYRQSTATVEHLHSA